MHILEVDVCAWVCLIASHYTREESTNALHVSQGNVMHCDAWLSLTFLDDWVEHAAWTATVWLLLLLRSNVYVPPDGLKDPQVLIKNVFNDTIAIVAWVRLDVDGFEWEVEVDISEGDIADASVVSIGGD